MNKLKVIDLCAGIGGMRIAFDRVFGDDIETVFVSEPDVEAKKIYTANFHDSFEIVSDIDQLDEHQIPPFDICLSRIPVQTFAMGKKERGLYDICEDGYVNSFIQYVFRICKTHKPKVIFFESVKGLALKDKGNTLKIIKKLFNELGYSVYPKVLNSKEFGVPQSRERLYLVCFKNEIDSSSFSFPNGYDDTKRIFDILQEAPVPANYYLTSMQLKALRNRQASAIKPYHIIRDITDIAGTVTSWGMGVEKNLIIDSRPHSMISEKGIEEEINKENIRRMTPREWARLQGFPDSFRLELSDRHLYQQIGKSVTVNVIEAIAKEIKRVLFLPLKEINQNSQLIDSDESKKMKKKLWEFNYGEWTEAYVFLQLLGMGRIYGANKDFKKDDNVYLDVIRIIRHEGKNLLEFERKADGDFVIAKENGKLFRTIKYAEFLDQANYLFEAMKNVTSKDHKFPIKRTEDFLTNLHFSQPKIPTLPKNVAEEYGSKTDIILETRDAVDQGISMISFSIKSHVGSNATLFNTAPASGLIYELVGCDDAMMNDINGKHLKTPTATIKFIKNNPNIDFCFRGTSDEFESNLQFIDLQMPEILNCMILIQIGYYDRADSSDIKDLVKKVEEYNPVKAVKRPERWYKANVKSFLYGSFAGLTATNPWNGENKLSGGYIDVAKSGEMLFYRALSDELFMSYLYNITYIDKPGRGVNQSIAHVKADAHLNGREATREELNKVIYKPSGKKQPLRGDWGYVYKENGKYYLKINFTVRFR